MENTLASMEKMATPWSDSTETKEQKTSEYTTSTEDYFTEAKTSTTPPPSLWEQ